ncbi:MAG: LPS export ABC transporter permease LptF [Deltaproteobacteria bacterium]|nr:LPS export ABC transporter permease LptF [Deltaproteobacteria bacterium]
MKIFNLINRYVFIEMLPVFVLSLLLFTLVFLMAKILDITDLIVQYGISAKAMFLMLACWIPSFLIFVIPMAVMIAVVLAFLRLSNDNEILAMKAAGISIYRLLPSVLAFCLFGFLATAFMTIYGSPWGRHSFKNLVFETASSNAHAGIKERAFNASFQDVMLYVNEVDERRKLLTDIFVEDRRTEGMVTSIIAPSGKFFYDPQRLVSHLRLYDGTINQLDQENQTAHFVRFNTYDFQLDFDSIVSSKKWDRKSRKEMNLSELRHSLDNTTKKDTEYYLQLMQYHKKFSIPFSCFVLGLVAIPLGIQSKSAKRSFGVILALFFFLIYYSLLSMGSALGKTGQCPPIVGMWIPNLVIGVIAAYLLFARGREQPIKILSISLRISQWLRSAGKSK